MLVHKISILVVFAIAANLDNLGVGIAYGLRRDSLAQRSCKRISDRSNLAIALMAIGLTFISMKFGQWVQPILPVKVANDLGGGAIIAVGIWVYFEVEINQSWLAFSGWCDRTYWSKISKRIRLNYHKDRPISIGTGRPMDRTALSHISVKETLILGCSLSLNAMAGGFGAGLAGQNPIATSIAVGIFSYVTIAVGQNIASTCAGKWLGSLSQKIAGLLLIAIGIYELLF